jgi:hypothetical protein
MLSLVNDTLVVYTIVVGAKGGNLLNALAAQNENGGFLIDQSIFFKRYCILIVFVI